MVDDKIETTTSIITLRSDGIVLSKYKPNAKETEITARENIKSVTSISNKTKVKLLCDYTNISSMNKGARKYYASEEVANGCLACAIIITNPISKIIGNFFMGLNKPYAPTKLFTSKETAIVWLHNYL